jgi:glycyl-tRNA synthetase alpha chain
VYDLEWAPGVTYGDIHHADEVQYSKFNFELANTDIYRREFDDREVECNKLLDAGLIFPAYDEVIRCSHAFNLLDARGAIGVTHREAYIGRVRKLARRCAESYLAFKAEARAGSPTSTPTS